MKRRSGKMAIIAVLAVCLIMAVVIGWLAISGFTGIGHNIEFPEVSESSENEQEDNSDENDNLNRVTVDTANVQNVINTLSRPVSYEETVTVTKYVSGESVTYDIQKFVNGEDVRLIIDSGGYEKNIIISDSIVYVWYSGDLNFFTYEINELSSYEIKNLADEYGMLLTYEEILDLESEKIWKAEYTEYGGTDCIFVSASYGSFDYAAEYYVSVSSGLLVSASVRDENGELIYSMEETDYTNDVPDNTYFNLPDGDETG